MTSWSDPTTTLVCLDLVQPRGETKWPSLGAGSLHSHSLSVGTHWATDAACASLLCACAGCAGGSNYKASVTGGKCGDSTATGNRDRVFRPSLFLTSAHTWQCCGDSAVSYNRTPIWKEKKKKLCNVLCQVTNSNENACFVLVREKETH